VTIPVRNVYYLLSYAWNHVQKTSSVRLDAEQFDNTADMLGHVFANAVAGLIKAGLDRNYEDREAVIPGVRGKLDISETVRRRLPRTGKTYCHFDELTYDVLQNRLIKATARSLIALPSLDAQVKGSLRGIVLHMRDVSDMVVQRRHFSLVRVHRNNRGYDFVLKVARLIQDSLLPNPLTGRSTFHDFRSDDARMAQLFEDFLFNFYRREQREYRVDRRHIQWDGALGSAYDLDFLPIMRTDIVLHRPDHTLVIDAKYYQEALTGRFGQDKVRSALLYQIFTYLENLRPRVDGMLEGMLLYPVVGEHFHFDYHLHGHRIRVAAINLDQAWQEIRAGLLELCFGFPIPNSYSIRAACVVRTSQPRPATLNLLT
jgi:5-methylcytosine-specific restriction enzyme subunit McrC